MESDIDEASLRLIISLQLQDAESLIKGKHREDEAQPDGEFSAELYKHELETLQTFCSDRALCSPLGGCRVQDGSLSGGDADRERQVMNKRETSVPSRASPDRESPNKAVTLDEVVHEETVKQLFTAP